MNLYDFVLILAHKLFLSHQGISARRTEINGGLPNPRTWLALFSLSCNVCRPALLISNVCFEYNSILELDWLLLRVYLLFNDTVSAATSTTWKPQSDQTRRKQQQHLWQKAFQRNEDLGWKTGAHFCTKTKFGRHNNLIAKRLIFYEHGNRIKGFGGNVEFLHHKTKMTIINENGIRKLYWGQPRAY